MTNQPPVVTSRVGDTYFWHVGDSSLSVSPARAGWSARVRRRDWGPDALSIDGHFATEEEAVAWCGGMAAALAQDQVDDQRSF